MRGAKSAARGMSGAAMEADVHVGSLLRSNLDNESTC